jgi:hypothetical protein
MKLGCSDLVNDTSDNNRCSTAVSFASVKVILSCMRELYILNFPVIIENYNISKISTYFSWRYLPVI